MHISNEHINFVYELLVSVFVNSVSGVHYNSYPAKVGESVSFSRYKIILRHQQINYARGLVIGGVCSMMISFVEQ